MTNNAAFDSPDWLLLPVITLLMALIEPLLVFLVGRLTGQ
jgi:hypothetical protein